MRATLLVPTWDAAETLAGSVRSGLRQTVHDLEVLIVGDGVTEPTRAVIESLLDEDPRVRFLDLPKGEGRGERNRDAGVRAASSDAIVYLCDDDLILDRHVEIVLSGLAHHEFVQTLNGYVDDLDRYVPLVADLADEGWRTWHLSDPPRNRTSMTGTAHSRSAYLTLSDGWQVAPPGIWGDLLLWRQFFARPELRAATLSSATVIQFPADVHRDRSVVDRVESFRAWSDFIRREDAFDELQRIAARANAQNLLGLLSQVDDLRAEQFRNREFVEAATRRLEAAEGSLERVLASSSWRVTAPLRAIGRLFRGRG